MDSVKSLLPKTSLMSATNRIADPAAFFSVAYNAWHRGSFSELICAAFASLINSIFLFIATWVMIFQIDWAAVSSCQLGSGCSNAEFIKSGANLRGFGIFTGILAVCFVVGCAINVIFATKHMVETYYHAAEVRAIVSDIVAVEAHPTPFHEWWDHVTTTGRAVKEAISRAKAPASFSGEMGPRTDGDEAAASEGIPLRMGSNSGSKKPLKEDDQDEEEEDEGSVDYIRRQHQKQQQQQQQQQAAGTSANVNVPTSSSASLGDAAPASTSSSPREAPVEASGDDGDVPSSIPNQQQKQPQKQALEDISWTDFSSLLVRRCRKFIVHGDSFDELRMVQTIMLQDNYLISLHACNLLNGRSLRWVDEQLIREIMKMHFLDRRIINAQAAFEKTSATVKKWFWVSVIFYPVVVSFFVIKALVRHAAEVRSQSARLTTDTFTPEARWRTRLFNELPFLYETRLSNARGHLEAVTGSQHAASTQLLRIPHRIAGIIISAILIVSLFSAEAAALGKFWGLSGAFWFSIALMMYRWTESRAAQAGSDDTTAGTGDQAAESGTASTATRSKSILQLVRPVADALLYEDVEWNIDKSTPRRCLDSLKRFYVVSRAMNAVNKMAFVIFAPLFLWRLLSNKNDELWPIAQFMETHTTFVNGIGSVCSFSVVPTDQMARDAAGAGSKLFRDPGSSFFGFGAHNLHLIQGSTTDGGGGAPSAVSSLPRSTGSTSAVEMQDMPSDRSGAAAAAAEAPPLPTTAAGASQMQVEFSTEDFRRCRIINASAMDPYVEDHALVHKRDLSLVAFGAAHRHWADSMYAAFLEVSGAAGAAAGVGAASSVAARMSAIPEPLQVQSVFMAKILPSIDALWDHFKNNTASSSFWATAAAGPAYSSSQEQQQQQQAREEAQHQRVIRTYATPENFVKLFARLRDYSEFDFLRLILDTRSEQLLKAAASASAKS